MAPLLSETRGGDVTMNHSVQEVCVLRTTAQTDRAHGSTHDQVGLVSEGQSVTLVYARAGEGAVLY